MGDGASTSDRLADFVALNDPATRRRVERDGGYFVVEGPLAAERLFDLVAGGASWRIRTVALLDRIVDRLRPRLDSLPVVRSPSDLVICDEAELRAVVGFDLHRGVLASVERQPLPPAADLLRPGRVHVATEAVNDHENLGALYRNAAAFGAAAVLIDPTTADPFYRRSVRVSAGHVLAVPTGSLAPLPHGLDALREAGAVTVALTPSGDVDLRDLDPTALGAGDLPVVLVVGAEGPGLTSETLAAADHRVRIDLADGVDSLNVATTAAIALHHLSHRRPTF